MLFISDWFTFLAFWALVVQLFRLDKRKTVTIFVMLWAGAYFGFPLIGIAGAFYFISFKALLCLAMMFIELYLRNVNKGHPRKNPLNKIHE